MTAGPYHRPTHRWGIIVQRRSICAFFCLNTSALKRLREMNESFELTTPEGLGVCAFVEKTASEPPPADLGRVRIEWWFMYTLYL